MTRRILMGLVCLFGVLIAVPLFADELLPRDDNNVYGMFDNGFKYIMRKHAKPPGRVAMYLHVKTGSLNESDKQNGIAHFLEHMAFNGSKHFKPGELVPYLNSLGMQFGADTNAHTNQHETVYKLFLPDTREETIEKCMTVLADDAYGLEMTDKEIENERKIILEEFRSGQSAQFRLNKEMLNKLFPGSKMALHDVIGLEEQIKTFPKKEFEDYWNTWYKPDNMTLIVVGDIEPMEMIERARKHFANMKARGVKRPVGKTGIKAVDKPRAFVLSDKEQVVCQIEMIVVRDGRPPMRTVEDYRFNEIENIGTWIVNRRLDEMTNKGTAKFRSAGVTVEGAPLNDAILPSATVIGEPEDWNAMLEQAVVEINRALEHGFTDKEIEQARTALLSAADRAVQTEPTADARVFVTRFAASVGNDLPILSAMQRLIQLKMMLPDVKAAEVHKVFVENFKTQNYAYVLKGPKKDGVELPTDEELLAAAREAWARKTSKPKSESDITSLVASLPAAGKIENKETDDDLKITTATFENGTILHHRYMDYKKDQVMVLWNMPGGQIEETAANKGVSHAAGQIFKQPATSKAASTQIRDFMTGKKISVDGGIGRDVLSVHINGKPSELALGFELTHALLTDGRLEESALDNWKKATIKRLEMAEKSPGGPIRKALDETVFGGDIRFRELTPADVKRQERAAAEAWIKRIVESAPIEVTIVGDIDFDKAAELVGKYVACLPKRTRGFDCLDSLRKIDRPSGPFKRSAVFDSITPQAVGMAGFISCAERDVADRRVLSLAARVLTDRMIKEIRENQQLVYSIGCENRPSRELPDTGLMMAGSTTDPVNGEKLADVVLKMMKEFADKEPSDEEVATARKQLIKGLETNMKEPQFWLGQISEMAYRKRPLSELKELPKVYETITAKQMQETVRKYMTDDRIVRIVATPEDKEAVAKEIDQKEDKTPSKKEEPAGAKG